MAAQLIPDPSEDEVIEPRKKGRPRKTTSAFDAESGFSEENRGKRIKAWKPKRWRPEYERMVAFSCLGYSNKMIGEKLGYTKEHVSTILNMDEAETIRIMVLEKMRASVADSIPDTLTRISQKTVKLLDQSFENEDLVKKSPFALIDRGLDVLKGLGHLKGGGNGSGTTIDNRGGMMIVTASQDSELAEALRKSDEVKKLHAGVGAEVIVSQSAPK